MRTCRAMLTWVGAGAVVLICAGCGVDTLGLPDSLPPPLSLTVRNESQFVILELKVHETTDYDASADELSGELLFERQQMVIDPFPAGSYVTIIRDQVENGPRLAVTTASGIEIDRSGYELLVFDESFRLLDP